jgi:hypothetical protein
MADWGPDESVKIQGRDVCLWVALEGVEAHERHAGTQSLLIVPVAVVKPPGPPVTANTTLSMSGSGSVPGSVVPSSHALEPVTRDPSREGLPRHAGADLRHAGPGHGSCGTKRPAYGPNVPGHVAVAVQCV